MRIIFISFLVFFLVTTSKASDLKIYSGDAKLMSCKKVLEGDDFFYLSLQNYLSGFISAANEEKGRDIVGIKQYDYVVWVKKYCRENPLQSLYVATVMLDRELDKLQYQ